MICLNHKNLCLKFPKSLKDHKNHRLAMEHLSKQKKYWNQLIKEFKIKMLEIAMFKPV